MRLLVDGDFPLTRYGVCVFAKSDPVPLATCESEDAADTIAVLLNLGFRAAMLAGERHAGKLNDMDLGAAVYSLAKGEEQLGLPLDPEPVEEAGWTLDRAVKRA